MRFSLFLAAVSFFSAANAEVTFIKFVEKVSISAPPQGCNLYPTWANHDYDEIELEIHSHDPNIVWRLNFVDPSKRDSGGEIYWQNGEDILTFKMPNKLGHYFFYLRFNHERSAIKEVFAKQVSISGVVRGTQSYCPKIITI